MFWFQFEGKSGPIDPNGNFFRTFNAWFKRTLEQISG